MLDKILEHKKCIVHPKDSKDDEEDNFEEVPISVISYLEQYEFASTEGIHCLWWTLEI